VSDPVTPGQEGEIIFYTTPEGATKVEVSFADETSWLSQKRMAELFGVDVRTVNEHLKNIFESKELQESATIRKFRIARKEGDRDVSREIEFYNLDAIIDDTDHVLAKHYASPRQSN